ncbi:fasciclin domain-containing protein [Halorubellus salinus]|uniref:fasciclin domain-containing protein n=1 Tax=Halorubellus salinus TaxID=755309 RepID=UPI001D09686A|nr:fasciclin domain-containing protein [Halorubellus salinus]
MTPIDRRTVLKTLATGTLLATGVGTAAARPGKGKRQGASAEQTITDIAAGNPSFSTLVAALQETGLDDVLDSEDGQYTVFAPTNAAFDALLEALDATPEELLARDDLATILKYHVTKGRRYAPSIVNPAPVTMLAGGKVTTDGTSLNDGQANITATDIEASNGVVHVIDGVLLP